MKSDSLSYELRVNSKDILAPMAKGAASLVPFVGPLLAEVIGVVIPNQRMDRIVKFARILDCRLNAIEKDLLEQRLKDEYFTDLIEEGFRQAARSLSDERRSYIASLIMNGLSSDGIDCAESKHILRILGEINDIEVIWLRFYREPYMGGDEAFRETHSEILQPVMATLGSSQEVVDRETLQKSYKDHLCQLGLLEAQYHTDHQTGLPEFDRFSGAMKKSGYRLTSLGRFLLYEIGLGEAD